MAIRTQDAAAYVDPKRWAPLARVKRESWLARRRRGPARQLEAIDELRAFARSAGGWPSAEAREEDLRHHIRVSALMRRADARRR